MPEAAELSRIESRLADAASGIDSLMANRLARRDLPDALRDAMSHALLGGGKRLRPALATLCCEAVGGVPTLANQAAVAVEFVHAFSLVHDDLPAMDDDDMRRGLPTVHAKYGEAVAILAGDALLSEAFAMIVDEAEPSLVAPLLRELADATGAMIAGQFHDTVGGLDELDPAARVQRVHSRKTGALIRAACRMGALSARCDETALSRIDGYATAIGLMYQIVDDLVDIEQTTDHAGKRTGKDAILGKQTYPGVLGVDASRKEVESLRLGAHAALADLGDCGSSLGLLADWLATRTR